MTPEDRPAEQPGGAGPGWGERLSRIAAAARGLIAARLAMFRVELSGKRDHLARGLAGVVIATSFGCLALFLFTAFLAALLSRLLGTALGGIGVTFLLYAAVAAICAYGGARKLARVRPFDYPATRSEITDDVAAMRAAMRPPQPPEEPEARADGFRQGYGEDVEARFREGSE